MKGIPFTKYSGNGNDFIILDHPSIAITPELVSDMCSRHFGIGADGVLVLESAESFDGVMRIFNADGGEAEMCGNGLRCLVTFLDKKLNHARSNYKIKTMNATYDISKRHSQFAIEMSEIKDRNLYDLSVFQEFEKAFYINTGVPHLVFLAQDLNKLDIKQIGSKYRNHSVFPNGTNVNFVKPHPTGQSAYVRTYERGVEDETFSCGTGLTATALALNHWLGWTGEIYLETMGGKQLVDIGTKIYFSGEVKHCFDGEYVP